MLFSQSQNMAFEDWKTTAGTQNFFLKSVTKTDPFGNIYVGGATLNGAGNYDILLAKYNASGVQLWIQQYAGAGNGTDFVGGLVVTDTYAVLTGAVTTSTASPTTDVITMKYTASGVFQWATTYNGSGNLFDAGKHVVLDVAGNVYISGAGYNASGNTDMITIKYNSTGTQQWVSTYNYTANLDDAATKVIISGTNITVTGPVTSAPNNYKLATLTYAQSTGSLTATNISTATTTSSITAVTDLTSDASGNNYIVGSTFVAGQGDNYYVQKLNATTLASAWSYTYNGASNLDDIAKNVVVDASNNVYITGYSTSSTQGRNIVTIKLNASGVFQWSQTINSASNGNDEAWDMVIDASSNIYIAGNIASDINQQDYYAIKYNSSGTKIWDIQTDGNHLNDQPSNMALDSLNNVIITGQTETAPNMFNFTTVKYVQKDVITPTDFNGETSSEAFWYFQNQGQIRNINDSLMPEIKYYTDKTNPGMFINNNSMRFVMTRGDTIASTNDTIQSIKMEYINVNATAKAYPLEKQNYNISYFQGTGRDFAGINANAKVITPNIYPNIDLIYSSNQNGIKYYYIVKPGGNLRNIQIQFTGATSYSLNATTNDLTLNTLVGKITFDKPIAYQLSASNTTIAVTSFSPNWVANGASNKYKFNTGTYTSSLTLVIEVDQGNATTTSASVGNLDWNTYMGGNWDDSNIDLKLDKWGNIYTLAFTNSSNFNTLNTFTTSVPSLANVGTMVMKYDKFGKRKNQVYVGSNANTIAAAITIVNDSNVVLVGGNAGTNLSGPFGGSNPPSAFTSSVGPGFIMKFDSTLSKIRWSTRYPGQILDVDSKNNGHIYLCAVSHTVAAYIKNQIGATNIPISAITSAYSTMVSKFNKNGVPLWSSYVGVFPLAANYLNPMHIKIDTLYNEFYVFGKNNSGSVDWRGYNSVGTFYQANRNSAQDCYIKKFDISDSMIVSTWYGGNKDDELSDAVITKTGDVYFVGSTNSTDTVNILYNPLNGSYFSKKYDNSYNKGWIVKFDRGFNRKWATLYGDSLKRTAFKAVTADNIYDAIMIGGYTEGMPNMTFGGSYNKASDSFGDGAFVSFNNTNQLTWATSMGVNNLYEDGIFGVQFNPKNNNLVFAGASDGNSNYPWVQYPSSYWQNFNFASGHNECSIGRFNVTLNMLVSVKEIANQTQTNSDIILFPNPTNQFANLYFKKGIENNVMITMCNALGQVIETKEIKTIADNTTLSFNTTQLSEGMYFINIITKNNKTTLKFVTFK